MAIRNVTDRASLDALIALMRLDQAAYAGDDIRLSNGDYGSTIIDLSGIVFATAIAISNAVGHSPVTPGFKCDSSAKITFLGDIRCYRARGDDPTHNTDVCTANGASDITFDIARIHSVPLADQDYTGYVNVTPLTGTFQHGETVRVYNGATPTGGTGIYRNDKPLSTSTRFAICGSGSDTTCYGTEGGFNGGGGTAYDDDYSQWRAGLTLVGDESGATATLGTLANPNFNGDTPLFLNGVGATDGVRITVQNTEIDNVRWPMRVGGSSGHHYTLADNDCHDCYQSYWNFAGQFSDTNVERNRGWDLWASHYDGQVSGTGGPHNSVGGWSNGSNTIVNVSIQDNVRGVGTARKIRLGTQAGGSNDKINDNSGYWFNLTYKRNRSFTADSLWEFHAIASGEIDNNLCLVLPETSLGVTTPLYIHKIMAGTKFRKNIMMTFAVGSDGDVAAEVYRDSYDNLVIHPNAASGPSSLAANFAGIAGSFDGATLDNIEAMFTPKAGGRVALGEYGPAYTFAGTKPRTVTATGVDMDRVQFNGTTQWMRYARTPDAALFGQVATSTDEFAGRFGLIFTDNRSVYLCQSASSAFAIRRLSTGVVRISGVGWEINSSLKFPQGEFCLLTFEFKWSNYTYRLMKGPTLDPFVTVSSWTSSPMSLAGATFTLMGQSTTDLTGSSSLTAAEVAIVELKPSLIGLDSQTKHNQLVALDGFPCDDGADGATLWGAAPPVRIKGGAAAYAAGFASPAKLFVTTGGVTLAHAGGGGPPDPPVPPVTAGAVARVLRPFWI